MINFFRFLIFGHLHKYEILETAELKSEGRVIGKVYVTHCKGCGKIKVYREYAWQ